MAQYPPRPDYSPRCAPILDEFGEDLVANGVVVKRFAVACRAAPLDDKVLGEAARVERVTAVGQEDGCGVQFGADGAAEARVEG